MAEWTTLPPQNHPYVGGWRYGPEISFSQGRVSAVSWNNTWFLRAFRIDARHMLVVGWSDANTPEHLNGTIIRWWVLKRSSDFITLSVVNQGIQTLVSDTGQKISMGLQSPFVQLSPNHHAFWFMRTVDTVTTMFVIPIHTSAASVEFGETVALADADVHQPQLGQVRAGRLLLAWASDLSPGNQGKWIMGEILDFEGVRFSGSYRFKIERERTDDGWSNWPGPRQIFAIGGYVALLKKERYFNNAGESSYALLLDQDGAVIRGGEGLQNMPSAYNGERGPLVAIPLRDGSALLSSVTSPFGLPGDTEVQHVYVENQRLVFRRPVGTGMYQPATGFYSESMDTYGSNPKRAFWVHANVNVPWESGQPWTVRPLIGTMEVGDMANIKHVEVAGLKITGEWPWPEHMSNVPEVRKNALVAWDDWHATWLLAADDGRIWGFNLELVPPTVEPPTPPPAAQPGGGLLEWTI